MTAHQDWQTHLADAKNAFARGAYDEAAAAAAIAEAAATMFCALNLSTIASKLR